jgi:hypothetical protein
MGHGTRIARVSFLLVLLVSLVLLIPTPPLKYAIESSATVIHNLKMDGSIIQ